jgi:zinc protease
MLSRSGDTMRLAAFVCLFLGFIMPAHADLDIVEVTSQKGIKAWLVEDQSDPIVAVSFAFRGGSMQEPQGKEGLAGLMTSLLQKGAGGLDADAYQQQFYETGAQLSFDAGQEAIWGTLRMVAGETEEPLRLLALALASPRFDEAEFARERTVAISRVRATMNDPDARGQRKLAAALYGDHPLGRTASEESLAAIEREDLAAFHGKLFARSNLVIGVVGAIDPDSLSRLLDERFGDLPEEADLADIPPPDMAFGKTVWEVSDRPQTSVSLFFPGVPETSPEIYSAGLLSEIIGGGFDSRLFVEMREKRGLTYGVGAGLGGGEDWGSLMIGFSSRSERTGQAMEVAESVVRQMIEDGPTDEELAKTKRYLIGSYSISRLSSTTDIAETMVDLQRLGRSRNHVEERAERIDAVTREEVQEMARQLLSRDPTALIVGPEQKAR